MSRISDRLAKVMSGGSVTRKQGNASQDGGENPIKEAANYIGVGADVAETGMKNMQSRYLMQSNGTFRPIDASFRGSAAVKTADYLGTTKDVIGNVGMAADIISVGFDLNDMRNDTTQGAIWEKATTGALLQDLVPSLIGIVAPEVPAVQGMIGIYLMTPQGQTAYQKGLEMRAEQQKQQGGFQIPTGSLYFKPR